MKFRSDNHPEIYEFADLSRYTFSERLIIRFVGLAIYLIIWIIGKTVRFETIGAENLTALANDGRVPILALWHDRMALGMYCFRNRGVVVASSQSFDAEFTARAIQRLGYGVVKGSSTRGGTRALVGMIRLLRDRVPIGLTVDGPKGPRHQAKSGACSLAKATGDPIVPICVEAVWFKTLGSWDKLQIPMPFTRARLLIGPPIFADSSADRNGIEKKRDELQASLDRLVETGERWRLGLES